MLNRCTFMGRLTRDPELRRTGSGIAVTGFTIAVDRDVVTKDSNERKTDFFDMVAWRATGEFIAKYFRKGSMIIVDCRAEQRQWTDKDGNKRNTIEFNVDTAYFGEPKKDGGNNASGGYAAPGAGGGYAAPSVGGGYAAPGAGGGYAAPSAGGGYAAPGAGGGYAAPSAGGGYAAPGAGGGCAAPAPAASFAPPAPAYTAYAASPAAPATNFAMLEDSDAQLPF